MPLNVGGASTLYWKTGLDNRGLRKDAKEAKGILAGLVKQISALDIFAVVATWTTIKVKALIKESTLLAARYETLGVVLETVGNNAGYSAEQMNEYAKSLEKTGISMLKARQTLIQMLQAQMDINKATQLGRIAQDAAVIGNINSSEAFNRMITGIQQGRLIILRTIGINVQFEKAYNDVAKAADRTAESLTEVEKVQIRTNVVIEAGTRIAGAYEAAMGTAGKQLLSLERHVENLKILIGKAFTPALTEIIENITGGIKDLNTGLTENEKIVETWGGNFRLNLIKVEDEVMRLAMLIDEVGGTMSAAVGIWATAMGVAFPYVPQFKNLAEDAAKWNTELEARFKKTEAAREANAKKFLDVEFSMTDVAKEEAEKRKKIAEEELLHKRKLAKEAEARAKAGAPDLSIWGLLSPEEMNDFAAEMAKAAEKQAEENKQIQIDAQNTLDDYAIIATEQMIKEREKVKKAAEKKSFDDIIQNTRKMNKQQLQEYLKFLQSRLILTEGSVALEEAIYERLAEVTEEIFERDLQYLNDIGDAFSALSKFMKSFDSDLANTVNQVAILVREIGNMGAATNPFQQMTAGIGIASAAMKILDPFVESLIDKMAGAVKRDASVWNLIRTKPYGAATSTVKYDIGEIARLTDEIEHNFGTELLGDLKIFTNFLSGEVENFAWNIQHTTGEEQENLKIFYEQLADRLSDIQEQYERMLTGTTRESIADSIADGFADGVDSAELFANTFEDLMKGALIDTFKRQFITKYIDDWYKDLAHAMETGGELTSAEAWTLGEDLKRYLRGGEAMWENILDTAGLPGLFDVEGAKPTGISGAIKGITEQTAGLLEGQFNAVRMNTVLMVDRMDDMIVLTSDIVDNTEYLKSIDSKLGGTSPSPGQNDYVRATGG